ncbi:2-amino-4-hydroxy-6-hydroxymethyldihydropteridine diphosphokinase [Bacterioplanes sanyensis]|jgi:2-amino-4-hydroxy-6-hydroxymethyldihydropteridine diphosphokinase|uniref:2-amino-4-hydroxy-6- hydroxymethyldihydropteridine diphosphokinase n=1 Tax=Bacterioplanes sanyensis TaxID=1249553 RepID=UPI00167BBA56|nr:2-amino-4-hydroxy-6-hydroxymethyldihydropteridine diphosphokinase [Bacterioplanes sanyensis]GGY36371.1 2-amino-4-hydroxy-6-hydroxymethyldihydropteridine diphosphokinase [Bacterioplanes sanyensis]
MSQRIFLGLGSNIDAERHLRQGIDTLAQRYRLIQESPWYASPAVGFDGPEFINLVVVIEASDSPAALAKALKQIEFDFGRPKNASKYSSRALDIDILLIDDLCGSWPTDYGTLTLPRDDIWRYAFVLRPLLDIAPHAHCPLRQQPLSLDWPALSEQPLRQLTPAWQPCSAQA